MNKPTKPTPTREPKTPERVQRETYKGSLTIYDGMSLTTVLAEIKKASTGVFPAADNREVERRHDGMPSFNALTFDLERGHYGDSDTMTVKWPAAIVVTRTDEAMTNLTAKYEADMVTYRTKLAAYEMALNQYEIDLTNWEADKQAHKEQAERTELARLLAKHGTPTK